MHLQSSTRLGAALAGVILSLSGCSMGPNSPNVRNALDMLRIERDAAEDEYYALKQKHDEALWEIEDLKTQLKGIQEKSSAAAASWELYEPSPLSEDEYDRQREDSRRGMNTSSSATGLSHRDSVLDSAAESDSEGPLFDDRDGPYVEPVGSGVESASVGSESEVSYVDLEPNLTRGFDSHGRSGDDGIVVALRPMDSSDRFVPIAAPVTISLIDPARNGIRQRVGLWRFTSEQVASRVDFDNQVFLFRLPWQRSAPVHSDLKLFVRYEANDGKRESEMELPVSLDDTPRSGWTTVEQGPDAQEKSPGGAFNLTDFGSPKNSASEATSPSTSIARPEWSPLR